MTNIGSKFIFLTNRNYANFSLIEIDFEKPDEKNWKYLIEGHEKNVLEWACCVCNKLIVCYIEDVKNVLQIHNLNTGEFVYKFPLEIGSIVGVSGKKTHTEMFYKFSSMVNPGTIYRVDLTKNPPTSKVMIGWR